MAKKSWKSELGKQIKAAREYRGISQGKLADRVRSTRASINSYENGSGNPRFKIITEIAAELKADFNVLGCRIVAAELLEPRKPEAEEQLELKFDHDHSFLANITIRPTKKSITITARSDYGVKSA
jgi:transcriptional regulator with XRE-family HTH domain